MWEYPCLYTECFHMFHRNGGRIPLTGTWKFNLDFIK